jgi:hypothetical protein
MMLAAAMFTDVMPEPARTAEAVQRHAAGADVKAGVERRHAPKVAALLADLGAGAPHHVVHLGGVQLVALGDGAQDGRAQTLRVNLGQRALGVFADPARGAAGVDDPGFGH